MGTERFYEIKEYGRETGYIDSQEKQILRIAKLKVTPPIRLSDEIDMGLSVEIIPVSGLEKVAKLKALFKLHKLFCE